MQIYTIINQINGKVYVGKTVVSLEERMKGHIYDMKKDDQRHLYKAMRKYGVENFEILEIDRASSIKELNKKEIFWISAYCSRNRCYGYNISSGGDGGPLFEGHTHSEETKQRQSEKMSGEGNPFYGKHHKEESKRYGSENNMYGKTGELNPFYGKEHTEETIKIIKDKNKNKWNDPVYREEQRVKNFRNRAKKLGITPLQLALLNILKEVRKRKNPFYGKTHTPETLEKTKATQFKKGCTPHNKIKGDHDDK